MRLRVQVLAVLLTLLPSLAAAGIDHIEPPFWWQGFEHRELQIMVHGEGIADYEPAVSHEGVSVTRVERGDSENYLFVYLTIDPHAATGVFELSFSNDGDTVSRPYELRERIPDHVGTFSNADVMYLITPDRFANGDPSNDAVEGYADAPDRSEPYGRHGGDLAGVQQHLDYIADMGFTQIWLNPVLENAMEDASYHGYATTNYYLIDPRYGSNEDYLAFVEAAKEQGVGVIMDMIANHMGSGHWWMDDLPAADWLNSPFDDPDDIRFSTHARTTNQDPYASEYDKAGHADGWFATAMPDLNQRNPLLADYIIQNSIWWVEYAGLSGIRQDTQPYPDKHFMTEWSRRIMQEYPDFNIVGEEWSPSPAITSYWQAGKENHDGYVSYMPSVMDFPVQIVLSEALAGDEPPWGSVWRPVYEMIGHDFLYADPFNLVIFPDNHDMSRIFTQVNEDEDLYRMAIVFYLTMRGIPQIYYGTEILMGNPGTTSHGVIRSDFPGGWDGDDINAFTGEGLTDSAREAQDFMRTLLNWRKDADVIHTGNLMQYAPFGSVYSYFRYDEDDTVMVIFNRGDESADVDTSRFSERLNGFTHGTDVLTGKRYRVTNGLVLGPRSVLVLELE